MPILKLLWTGELALFTTSAGKRTWTSMDLRPLAPKASASTNFAIPACLPRRSEATLRGIPISPHPQNINFQFVIFNQFQMIQYLNKIFVRCGRGGIPLWAWVCRSTTAPNPSNPPRKQSSLLAPPCSLRSLRKGWDSNPRYPWRHSSFQDWCIRPLCHPSMIYCKKTKYSFSPYSGYQPLADKTGAFLSRRMTCGDRSATPPLCYNVNSKIRSIS